jgi:hypothetical protein
MAQPLREKLNSAQKVQALVSLFAHKRIATFAPEYGQNCERQGVTPRNLFRYNSTVYYL